MKACIELSTISVLKCPYCDSINYADVLDNDYDGLTCWKCQKESVFPGMDEIHGVTMDELDSLSLMFLDGKEEAVE